MKLIIRVVTLFFLSILLSCAITPLTYICFYNDTDIEIREEYVTVNRDKKVENIDKYRFFSIVSPGNVFLPEEGEERILFELRSNGRGDTKMIVDNKEFTITPEIMANMLTNNAIYDYRIRRYYLKITELLEIFDIAIQDVNSIVILP